MYLLLNMVMFHCHVSFQRGIYVSHSSHSICCFFTNGTSISGAAKNISTSHSIKKCWLFFSITEFPCHGRNHNPYNLWGVQPIMCFFKAALKLFMKLTTLRYLHKPWLVVSAHLKNMSQNGNLPQIGVKIKNTGETTT